MKKLLTFGLCSLVLTPCLATEIKPFVGANIFSTGISYTDTAIKETAEVYNLPNSAFGIGLDVGIKITNDSVYNMDLSLAYDYNFNKDIDLKSEAKPFVNSAKLGFSMFSATFDNYIRISGEEEHRQDIVLGIGIASISERVKQTPTSLGEYYGLESMNEKDTGGATVLKIGWNINFDKCDFYINGRWFLPNGNKEEKDISAIFHLTLGARYIF